MGAHCCRPMHTFTRNLSCYSLARTMDSRLLAIERTHTPNLHLIRASDHFNELFWTTRAFVLYTTSICLHSTFETYTDTHIRNDLCNTVIRLNSASDKVCVCTFSTKHARTHIHIVLMRRRVCNTYCSQMRKRDCRRTAPRPHDGQHN